MPKRYADVTPHPTAGAEFFQRKTERSHEENQERAYIAASRRADRSIEARVQSARMASEIHKKRTGRGFKISEDIVVKEEMYEEEDDDLPRHYRALAAHLQTASPEMNNRLNAYLTNQVAMASLARQQEVNRMFAEQFPNASQISLSLSNSAYLQPLQQDQNQSQAQGPSPSTSTSESAATSPHFGHFDLRTPSHNLSDMRTHSMDMTGSLQFSTDHEGAARRHHSLDGALSPPVLSPPSADTPTPSSQHHIGNQPQQADGPSASAEPSLLTPSVPRQPAQNSPFTAELSLEAKQMANLDTNDPLSYDFLDASLQSGTAGMAQDAHFPMGEAAAFNDWALFNSQGSTGYTEQTTSNPYMQGVFVPRYSDHLQGNQSSNIGTPGGGDGDSWEAWVNTDQWSQVDPEELRI